MRKRTVVIFVLVFCLYMAGCGKKKQYNEEVLPEPMSMETLSTMNTEPGKATPENEHLESIIPPAQASGAHASNPPASEVQTPAAQTAASQSPAVQSPSAQALPASGSKLEPLPPSGPYQPSVNEIQLALKNAGYYNGKVDGKSGPMTKNAVEEYQKTNGLKADGKVGPLTWSSLSKYLSGSSVSGAAAPVAKKKGKSKKKSKR